LFELDNLTGGIGELDFFDNPPIDQLFKPNNVTGGIGEFDFFDNPRLY
jgi:hypothetical protein